MRSKFLPYSKPFIEDDDIASVVDSMRLGWLTTGPKTKALEEEFAAVCGVRHAVALSSCTAGLHLGLIALGVREGDEVVMPSLTFVAGAQCAREIGAVPVLCDVDPDTLCMSVDALRAATTDRTKAIIPMHYGGRPVAVEHIVAYARERNIRVLEDAAHAVGTLDNGKWAGAQSDAAVYSFYPTKNITTAEGGILVTNHEAVAERVRQLSLHGMNRDAWKRYNQGGHWRYDVVETGYKYNMPDTCAAIGLCQLRKLDRLQAPREELARSYITALEAIPGVRPVSTMLEPPDRHSWCMFVVRVDESQTGISRDDLIDAMREMNIGTSVHYIPTHLFSAYRDTKHGDLSVTNRVWPSLLSLPLYPSMSDAELHDVVEAMATIVDRARSRLAVLPLV